MRRRHPGLPADDRHRRADGAGRPAAAGPYRRVLGADGLPGGGTTLEDLQEATDVMLKAGMWVIDINDIQGHLSHGPGRLGQHITGPRSLLEIWDAVGLDDSITDYTGRYPLWNPWPTTTP